MDRSAPEWRRFARATREDSAQRNRRFLRLGAGLILAFSAFDILVDRPPAEVLRERLLNNGVILAVVLASAWALARPRVRRSVFALFFLLVVGVVAGQAYLLGVTSAAPGRLAFHSLAILGMTMLGIQWFWPWQLALTAVALGAFALVIPSDHPDFAFYLVSLAGCSALMIIFAQALVRLRYEQFVTDLRLRDAIEVQRRQTAQLEAKNAELNDLIFVLSHDLRAPLINLDGFSEQLGDGVAELRDTFATAGSTVDRGRWHDAEGRIVESLHFIRQGVARMSFLVTSILELARIDSKPSQLEPTDLGEIVRDVLASFQYQITQRGITVALADLPTIVADPLRLTQVMSNLIDNAIKYMPPTGPARIEVACERLPGHDIISVRDTGVGIRVEDQHKIFRLFSRAAHDDTPGDGIGLAAVKKIVEQRGGRIWVESAAGRGSVFRFTLPHAESSAPEREAAASAEVATDGGLETRARRRSPPVTPRRAGERRETAAAAGGRRAP